MESLSIAPMKYKEFVYRFFEQTFINDVCNNKLSGNQIFDKIKQLRSKGMPADIPPSHVVLMDAFTPSVTSDVIPEHHSILFGCATHYIRRGSSPDY